MNKPTVVSLFAGCGGSSLGYKLAGYDCRLAVEWDDNAVATYKLNFPNTPIYHGDISKLTGEDALSRTGLKSGELDVLDGSPPCQGFSMVGKREMNDARNDLFREYVRLLKIFSPRVLVMENVSGMVKGAMKLIFVKILRELKAAGYQVSCRLLNAMYFNVPQSRQRVIFIGVRNDLGIVPSHPKGQTRPRTVRDALGTDGFFFFSNPWDKDKQLLFKNPAPTTVGRLGLGGSRNSQCAVLINAPTGFAVTARQSALDYLPAPPLTGKTLQVAKMLRQGDIGLPDGSWWSSTRLHLNRQAPTVIKEGALFQRYPKWVHPIELRGLSIGELRRLASFPDDFEFVGSWVQAWARIGNSVPPLFMRAIAEHIKQKILLASSEQSDLRIKE